MFSFHVKEVRGSEDDSTSKSSGTGQIIARRSVQIR